MNPAIHDAHAATIRSDRERAAAGLRAHLGPDARSTRSGRGGPRARLGRALIAAGTRLAH